MGYAGVINILLNKTFKNFVVSVTNEVIFYPQRIILHATVHLFYEIWFFLSVHIVMHYLIKHNDYIFKDYIPTNISNNTYISWYIISKNHNLYKFLEFKDFKCRDEFLWRKMYFQLNKEIDKIIRKYTIILNNFRVYY